MLLFKKRNTFMIPASLLEVFRCLVQLGVGFFSPGLLL